MSADFVANMEDVLELYAEPQDPNRPVVCFDETSTQLSSIALPAEPEDDAGEEQQQPEAEAVATPEEPPSPPAADDADEDGDEPPPRTVRRRPFTSRLLRS